MWHRANRSTKSAIALCVQEDRIWSTSAPAPGSGCVARFLIRVNPVTRLGMAVVSCALLGLLTTVEVLAAERPLVQPIDWQTSPLDLDLRGMNGERYMFHCPPGKPQPSRVTGASPYRDDSPICTAAVHAGVIHPKRGGSVTIEMRPGQQRYTGSRSHYVTSGDYDAPWGGSFIVVAPEIIPSH